MKFELGKKYRHNSGKCMSIVAECNTTMYGDCFLAEENDSSRFSPVGKGEEYTNNWAEISDEEWMKNFS